MCELRPQVVLTFDPFGGYGHPDHIAIHRATVRAFERVHSDLLLPEHRLRKLYYTTFPRTLLRWTVRLMPLLGHDPSAVGKNKDINLRQVLAREMPITTRIDIRRYYDLRERAAACHSSQLSGPSSAFGLLPGWLVRQLRGTDTFHRAMPPFRKWERIERDLFAGIAS
jgi:LmbE family N-acetylglucosaminyl deacetylase